MRPSDSTTRRILNRGFSTLTLILLFAGGCGSGRDEVRLVEEVACPVYDDSSAALPRLLYADGTRTVNDRCMVRSAKLNPKIRSIYVNGLPMGFC